MSRSSYLLVWESAHDHVSIDDDVVVTAVRVSWRRLDRSCAWLRRELLGYLRVGSRLPDEPPGPGVGVPGPFGPGTP
jgi:hypothetical protein